MTAIEPAEIPKTFSLHLFACHQSRPPMHPRGSCGAQGAEPLWQRLTQQLEKAGKRDVAMTATGCLGFCRAGPIMVVYPQGIWYAPRTPEDIDEIVAAHVKEGRLVERLIIVPQV